MTVAADGDFVTAMPRPGHKAPHTHGQVHDQFRRLLGKTAGDERYNRILAMRVDGLLFRDRPIELRADVSNFYATAENEALSVARVLVDLDLDGFVENIERGDKPDVRVVFKNGACVFVECTTAADRGEIAFARYCETATTSFRRLIEADAPRRKMMSRRNVIVTISRRVQTLPSAESLANDAAAFIESTGFVEILCKRVTAEFDALGQADATVTVKMAKSGGYAMFKLAGDFVSMDGIGHAIQDAVETKRRKAASYPASSRPLWLVVTVGDDRLPPPILRPIVQDAVKAISEIDPFDAVIVEITSARPVVEGDVRLPSAHTSST